MMEEKNVQLDMRNILLTSQIGIIVINSLQNNFRTHSTLFDFPKITYVEDDNEI